MIEVVPGATDVLGAAHRGLVSCISSRQLKLREAVDPCGQLCTSISEAPPRQPENRTKRASQLSRPCPKGGRKLKTMNRASAHPRGLHDSVDVIVQRARDHRLLAPRRPSSPPGTHPPGAASVASAGLLLRAFEVTVPILPPSQEQPMPDSWPQGQYSVV